MFYIISYDMYDIFKIKLIINFIYHFKTNEFKDKYFTYIINKISYSVINNHIHCYLSNIYIHI
jgi:hypothetical protein